MTTQASAISQKAFQKAKLNKPKKAVTLHAFGFAKSTKRSEDIEEINGASQSVRPFQMLVWRGSAVVAGALL